jgi:ABC-type phosphate transport system auxiliary subunit
MSDQPEALRLADELERPVGTQSTYSAMQQSANELRRLHVANVELTECLEKKSIAIQRIWKERDELRAEVARLREALEDLVTLCNTDFVLAADPVVIAAEAALERLYRARTALARKEPDHA